MVEGRNQALGQWIGRTSSNRTLNFTHPDTGDESLRGQVSAGSRDALRAELVGGRKQLWCN